MWTCKRLIDASLLKPASLTITAHSVSFTLSSTFSSATTSFGSLIQIIQLGSLVVFPPSAHFTLMRIFCFSYDGESTQTGLKFIGVALEYEQLISIQSTVYVATTALVVCCLKGPVCFMLYYWLEMGIGGRPLLTNTLQDETHETHTLFLLCHTFAAVLCTLRTLYQGSGGAWPLDWLTLISTGRAEFGCSLVGRTSWLRSSCTDPEPECLRIIQITCRDKNISWPGHIYMDCMKY